MNLRKLQSIASQKGRCVVLLTCTFSCLLTFAVCVSTAHGKPTAKPAFNAAAKGMRPVYNQPKPVLRPPTPRPRGVAASPAARRMYPTKAPAKSASRATASVRSSTQGARNLRRNFANANQRRLAKQRVTLPRNRGNGPTRNLRGTVMGGKRQSHVVTPTRSNRTSNSSLRNSYKKANLKHKAKTQFGRAVSVPHATGKIRTRLTRPGETFYRVHSGATRGPYATPVKPKTSNQAKSSLALPRGNKATHLQKIVSPGRLRVTESRAAAAFGKKGGALQVRFQDKLPASAFKSLGWLKGGLSNVFNDISG